jgi:hypothetical protein
MSSPFSFQQTLNKQIFTMQIPNITGISVQIVCMETGKIQEEEKCRQAKKRPTD